MEGWSRGFCGQCTKVMWELCNRPFWCSVCLCVHTCVSQRGTMLGESYTPHSVCKSGLRPGGNLPVSTGIITSVILFSLTLPEGCCALGCSPVATLNDESPVWLARTHTDTHEHTQSSEKEWGQSLQWIGMNTVFNGSSVCSADCLIVSSSLIDLVRPDLLLSALPWLSLLMLIS